MLFLQVAGLHGAVPSTTLDKANLYIIVISASLRLDSLFIIARVLLFVNKFIQKIWEFFTTVSLHKKTPYELFSYGVFA